MTKVRSESDALDAILDDITHTTNAIDAIPETRLAKASDELAYAAFIKGGFGPKMDESARSLQLGAWALVRIIELRKHTATVEAENRALHAKVNQLRGELAAAREGGAA